LFTQCPSTESADSDDVARGAVRHRRSTHGPSPLEPDTDQSESGCGSRTVRFDRRRPPPRPV